jgi:hypothetical protein
MGKLSGETRLMEPNASRGGNLALLLIVCILKCVIAIGSRIARLAGRMARNPSCSWRCWSLSVPHCPMLGSWVPIVVFDRLYVVVKVVMMVVMVVIFLVVVMIMVVVVVMMVVVRVMIVITVVIILLHKDLAIIDVLYLLSILIVGWKTGGWRVWREGYGFGSFVGESRLKRAFRQWTDETVWEDR